MEELKMIEKEMISPPKKKAMPRKCLMKRAWVYFWQLVRLIIDTPLNIPSVLVSFDSDKNKIEILDLMNERSEKYKMLTDIGKAYTCLCILSITLLASLIIIGYVLQYSKNGNHWFIPTMAFSALPLAISPIYWYKKYCLKEFVRDIDDYIHLIELHDISEINSEYKSAIISVYFLRRHSKKTQITIDLTPYNEKYINIKRWQRNKI